MKRRMAAIVISLSVALSSPALAEGFDVLTLGARGGIQGRNLSSYMIHPSGDPSAVTCDAGALIHGLIS